jgi:hypothetical protein
MNTSSVQKSTQMTLTGTPLIRHNLFLNKTANSIPVWQPEFTF